MNFPLPYYKICKIINFPVNQTTNFYVVDDRPTSNPKILRDAFVVAFNSSFTLLWSTYVGGHFREEANAISFSPFNNRLYFAGRTTTNNATLDPSDTPLPNFEFDDNSVTDYWQVEPFENSDFPAWAAFFDVELMNDPTLFVVNEEFLENDIIIYPNPSTTHINIDSETTINSVYLININGRVVYSEERNSKTKSINTTSLSGGVYIIQVETAGETIRRKIVKQ